MTPEEVRRRMERVLQVVEAMDDQKRELAIQAGLLDRRFAKQGTHLAPHVRASSFPRS